MRVTSEGMMAILLRRGIHRSADDGRGDLQTQPGAAVPRYCAGRLWNLVLNRRIRDAALPREMSDR